MAPRADGKQMSAGFAVFLISFLVLTTLIVFAVLLFLSYENMYNNLILRVEHSTQAAANDLASDITSVISLQSEPFEYTINDDGTDNFKNSRIIDKFVNSQTYRSNGSVYITDNKGKIYCRNSYVMDVSDNLLTTSEAPLFCENRFPQHRKSHFDQLCKNSRNTVFLYRKQQRGYGADKG